MKYRSRSDIVTEILTIARDKAVTKTRIMYGAFLSWSQLNEYLAMLTREQMLEADGTGRYQVTMKGLRFLDIQKQITAL